MVSNEIDRPTSHCCVTQPSKVQALVKMVPIVYLSIEKDTRDIMIKDLLTYLIYPCAIWIINHIYPPPYLWYQVLYCMKGVNLTIKSTRNIGRLNKCFVDFVYSLSISFLEAAQWYRQDTSTLTRIGIHYEHYLQPEVPSLCMK